MSAGNLRTYGSGIVNNLIVTAKSAVQPPPPQSAERPSFREAALQRASRMTMQLQPGLEEWTWLVVSLSAADGSTLWLCIIHRAGAFDKRGSCHGKGRVGTLRNYGQGLCITLGSGLAAGVGAGTAWFSART